MSHLLLCRWDYAADERDTEIADLKRRLVEADKRSREAAAKAADDIKAASSELQVSGRLWASSCCIGAAVVELTCKCLLLHAPAHVHFEQPLLSTCLFDFCLLLLTCLPTSSPCLCAPPCLLSFSLQSCKRSLEQAEADNHALSKDLTALRLAMQAMQAADGSTAGQLTALDEHASTAGAPRMSVFSLGGLPGLQGAGRTMRSAGSRASTAHRASSIPDGGLAGFTAGGRGSVFGTGGSGSLLSSSSGGGGSPLSSSSGGGGAAAARASSVPYGAGRLSALPMGVGAPPSAAVSPYAASLTTPPAGAARKSVASSPGSNISNSNNT